MPKKKTKPKARSCRKPKSPFLVWFEGQAGKWPIKNMDEYYKLRNETIPNLTYKLRKAEELLSDCDAYFRAEQFARYAWFARSREGCK